MTDLVVPISEIYTCNDFIAQLRNRVGEGEGEGYEYLDDFLDTGVKFRCDFQRVQFTSDSELCPDSDAICFRVLIINMSLTLSSLFILFFLADVARCVWLLREKVKR
jgi:hypothetical protein